MTDIFRQSAQKRRGQLDLSDDGVTATAEQSADSPGHMVVIDDQETCRRGTEQASTLLGIAHRLDFLGRHSVFPHQASAVVVGACSLGIGLTPLTKTGVPAWPVLCPISAAPVVGAFTAVRPQVFPGLREGVGREVSPAVRASLGHRYIMPYQPCHADVLIELLS